MLYLVYDVRFICHACIAVIVLSLLTIFIIKFVNMDELDTKREMQYNTIIHGIEMESVNLFSWLFRRRCNFTQLKWEYVFLNRNNGNLDFIGQGVVLHWNIYFYRILRETRRGNRNRKLFYQFENVWTEIGKIILLEIIKLYNLGSVGCLFLCVILTYIQFYALLALISKRMMFFFCWYTFLILYIISKYIILLWLWFFLPVA